MNAKTGFGLALALTVTLLGSGVRAEQAAPKQDKAQTPKITPDETLTLKKDEVRTLTVKELTRVAVGDPTTADITVSGEDGVRITGRKQGETMLLVWTKDGKRKAYRLVIEG
jgi:Flp pilus assembly secretin CpaC